MAGFGAGTCLPLPGKRFTNGGSEREGTTLMDNRNNDMQVLVDEFKKRWSAAGGHIFEGSGTEAIGEAIGQAWQSLVGPPDNTRTRSLVYWMNEDLRQLPWDMIFRGVGPIHAYPWDPEKDIRALTAEADLGITGCGWAVAETGTVALVTSKETGLLPSVLPAAYLVLINQCQIVRTVREGLLSVNRGALPSILKLVTGPSMTADIEGTLVIGVHGPAKVGALLYDLPLPT